MEFVKRCINQKSDLFGQHDHTTWYEEGSEIHPFKLGTPSDLGSSCNSGLQGSPFQSLNITYDPLKQS